MTPTKPQFVPSVGPLAAKICVIGEAPWTQEVALGEPFKGKSGKLQDRWWMEVGLDRWSMRIMNMYPFKPPQREIESVKDGELITWMGKLHERLEKLTDVNVIVTLGNYATFALTGKGKVKGSIRKAFNGGIGEASKAEKAAGITKLRGSVYEYETRSGRKCKVIPIIHPAAVLQHAKWEGRCVADWEKVRRESESNVIDCPERRHTINPSEWEVKEFTEMVEAKGIGIVMSVDIETWGKRLSCVGFAVSPWESITVNLTGPDREVMLGYVKRLCESRSQKALCNGLFDWYWLRWYGVDLVNFVWDVQLMHHAINPADNHSLDYLASIYCRGYRYWKDEAKDAEEVVKYATDLEALWVYNGLDCCYTRELVGILLGELAKEGMVEFYMLHYQAMLEHLVASMLHGFRVDKGAQKVWAGRLREEMEELHGLLNEAAGEELFATGEEGVLREPTGEEWGELIVEGYDEKDPKHIKNGLPKPKFIDPDARKRLGYVMTKGMIREKRTVLKKDFSPIKLKKFFYETLGLPEQRKFRKEKKERTVALDEGAVRKLIARYPEKIKNYGHLLLAYREKKKELDYLKGKWDKDGRIRCSYKLTTEAGRLASSENPRRTGMNLQNLKR